MKQSELLDPEFLERVKNDQHTYGYPFVTISRQAGAGGHTLAEAIKAETDARGQTDLFTGWRIFDEQICTAIARDPELHVSLNELLTEAYSGPVMDFFHEIVGGQTSHYTVARRIFELIRNVTQFGKVIVVGRAAGLVTRRLPAGIHVRLTASPTARIRWMAQKLDISEEEAGKMIDRQDRDRARLVRDFFDEDIHDPSLYHRVWDTEVTPIPEIATEVLHLIKSTAHRVGRD